MRFSGGCEKSSKKFKDSKEAWKNIMNSMKKMLTEIQY